MLFFQRQTFFVEGTPTFKLLFSVNYKACCLLCWGMIVLILNIQHLLNLKETSDSWPQCLTIVPNRLTAKITCLQNMFYSDQTIKRKLCRQKMIMNDINLWMPNKCKVIQLNPQVKWIDGFLLNTLHTNLEVKPDYSQQRHLMKLYTLC